MNFFRYKLIYSVVRCKIYNQYLKSILCDFLSLYQICKKIIFNHLTIIFSEVFD